VAVAPDSGAVCKGPVEGLAEANADVFGGMMAVNLEVAGAGHGQVDQGMASEQLEHVVEKTDPGRYAGSPFAIQVEA
jgi:hypothetical protein